MRKLKRFLAVLMAMAIAASFAAMPFAASAEEPDPEAYEGDEIVSEEPEEDEEEENGGSEPAAAPPEEGESESASVTVASTTATVETSAVSPVYQYAGAASDLKLHLDNFKNGVGGNEYYIYITSIFTYREPITVGKDQKLTIDMSGGALIINTAGTYITLSDNAELRFVGGILYIGARANNVAYNNNFTGIYTRTGEDNVGTRIKEIRRGSESSGYKYYFINGDMQFDFQTIDGKRYFFDAFGRMQTGWLQIRNMQYYFGISGNREGVMATGWNKPEVDIGGNANNKWYYFGSSGERATGWVQLSGKWYYLHPDKNGEMLTGWWHTGSSTDNKMTQGFRTNNKDTQYYFSEAIASEGAMATGWVKLGGVWYYFESGGAMKTGWLKLGSTWYYLDPSSGVMATGFRNVGSKTYYFRSSGAMVTGWQKIGNDWYVFTSSGAMKKNAWDLYKNGSWYYLGADGKMVAGQWIQSNSKWYYLRASGAMATAGVLKLGDDWYYLRSGGARYENGSFTIDGNRYCFEANGVMVRNATRNINGVEYYFNKNGIGSVATLSTVAVSEPTY